MHFSDIEHKSHNTKQSKLKTKIMNTNANLKFGRTLFFLLAITQLANARIGEQSRESRNLQTSRKRDNYYTNSFEEDLGPAGQCTGAVCGMWGDPHIISCDGLGYDCNAAGLFTLMRNYIFNIQALFIHVFSEDMKMVLETWKQFGSATYSSDIVIQTVESPDTPLFQFSFPEFLNHDGLPPAEAGCFENFIYDDNYELGEGVKTPNLVACRKSCERLDGCTQFSYSVDRNCHRFDDRAQMKVKPAGWSRTLAGDVDKCGHPDKYRVRGDAQIEYARPLGNGAAIGKGKQHRTDNDCPVFFYLDQELQDISQVEDNGYLYQDEKSSVKLQGYNKIYVRYTTEKGNIAEIQLEVAGKGPGEAFSCHWNMFVCLPEEEKEDFINGKGLDGKGAGLLGSPDLNWQNDWMSPDGTILAIPSGAESGINTGTRGQEAFDYCTNK